MDSRKQKLTRCSVCIWNGQCDNYLGGRGCNYFDPALKHGCGKQNLSVSEYERDLEERVEQYNEYIKELSDGSQSPHA